MATRPSTPKGTAKVQPGQGIKVNYIYYWSEAFSNPAVGFAHVLVYGPSGVGKTTMIRQIARELNDNVAEHFPGVTNSLSYRNGTQSPMPLLLVARKNFKNHSRCSSESQTN